MEAENAIIFINNYDTPKKSSLFRNNLTVFQSIKEHFSVAPHKLPKRIINSLIPPFCGKSFKKIYVDLIGPIFAVFSLIILLNYGHSFKNPWAISKWSPIDTLLAYILCMPFLTYLLCKLANSRINFIEIVSILGYSLYGHILTLLTSLILYNEESNFVFFINLLIFGGLSTLRIVIILISCIPKPVIRLVICSFVSIVQLLFLVFLHFVYMHKRFIYGSKSRF